MTSVHRFVMFAGRRRSAPALLCACAILLAGECPTLYGKDLSPEIHHEQICQVLSWRLPRVHLSRMRMGDKVSQRAWTNYLGSLDYERTYFLREDINRFRQYETEIDDDLQDGDMEFAFAAFARFKERLSNRVDYVEQLLTNGFDLARDETYHWKRRDADWSRDAEEWNELWRKKIKNEYVRILISREASGKDLADANDAGSARTPESMVESITIDTNAITVTLPVATDLQAAAGASSNLTAAAGTTNLTTVATSTNAVEAAKLPTPEEAILKRYRQLRIVLGDNDSDWVLQKYLTAVMQAYDPHSSYMSASTLEDFSIEMKLSLVGIGALLRSEDGAAKVVRLISGGPADRDKRDNRLMPGDKIIAVAQDTEPSVDILHWSLQKVVRLIRGEKGTRVVLTVIPASDPTGSSTKTVDLIRDEVRLEEQAASHKTHTLESADGKTRKLGVIRLPAFYASMNDKRPGDEGFRSAVNDVRDLIWDMQREQVDGILLDLRNNGGGSLAEAIDMAGLFVRRGPMVQVKERFGLRPLSDEDPSVVYAGPLVILVNRLSASASEIVAGAMQDYGRAVVVGDSKTHGKGTVQSVLDIGKRSELGAMKVTTASYYRISGASTQLRGITPDIVVPSPWDFMETGEESLQFAIPADNERPAAYMPVADLGDVLPELRRRSESRRLNDERFRSYSELLEQVALVSKEPEVPLLLEKRRDFASTERRLSDLRDELASDAAIAAEEEEIKDLVLIEGLTILSDLVGMQRDMSALIGPLNDDSQRMKRSVVDWFRKNGF